MAGGRGEEGQWEKGGGGGRQRGLDRRGVWGTFRV